MGRHRYTVGGSSDDGGIGDLDRRRVIAVNPQLWNGDLRSWYQQNYAGIDYVPIQSANPAALVSVLRGLALGEIPDFSKRESRRASDAIQTHLHHHPAYTRSRLGADRCPLDVDEISHDNWRLVR